MKFNSILNFLQANRPKVKIVLLASIIYFFSYFQRIGIPGTIFNELQSSFNMSAGLVAMLGAIFLYIYGAMQLPAGMLADRLGGRRILVVGGSLLSLGSILFPLAPSVSFLLFARALVGLGSSFIYLGIIKEIDSLFATKDFTIILGVILFIGYTGGLVSTFPLERAVKFFGWRPALLTAGILCSVSLIGFVFFIRNKNHLKNKIDSSSLLTIGKVLKNRDSYPVLILGAINFGIYFLMQATIGKKLLEDCFAISSKSAASVTFLMMLTSMTFVFLSGFISRYIGNRRKPIIIAATLTTLFSIVLMIIKITFRTSSSWFLLSYILLAVSSALCAPAAVTLMKELNPSESAGTSIGLINGGCYLTIALVTNFAGVVMDCFKDQVVKTGSAFVYPPDAYRTILIGCFSIALCSFLVSFFVRESHGKNIYAVNGIISHKKQKNLTFPA